MKDSVGSGWTPQARIRISQFVHWKCCVVRGNVIQFETTRAFPNSRTVLFLNPWSRLNPSRWFQRPENQYQCLLFAMIFKKNFSPENEGTLGQTMAVNSRQSSHVLQIVAFDHCAKDRTHPLRHSSNWEINLYWVYDKWNIYIFFKNITSKYDETNVDHETENKCFSFHSRRLNSSSEALQKLQHL